MYRWYRWALAASQWKQGLSRVIGWPSRHEKSTARPVSWYEVPGRAVGGEHDDGGAWKMACSESPQFWRRSSTCSA